jgi:hypothetical protein
MKDGRTHLAHKAEHAVDLDTRCWRSRCRAPTGATRLRWMLPLSEAEMAVAEQVGREAELRQSFSCVYPGLSFWAIIGRPCRGWLVLGDSVLRRPYVRWECCAAQRCCGTLHGPDGRGVRPYVSFAPPGPFDFAQGRLTRAPVPTRAKAAVVGRCGGVLHNPDGRGVRPYVSFGCAWTLRLRSGQAHEGARPHTCKSGGRR